MAVNSGIDCEWKIVIHSHKITEAPCDHPRGVRNQSSKVDLTSRKAADRGNQNSVYEGNKKRRVGDMLPGYQVFAAHAASDG
jgi:hypothetical protein